MSPRTTSGTRGFARALRTELTDAERCLWWHLRRSIEGVKFRRQIPVGPYIADFACLRPKLVLELDGGQHALAQTYDSARTEYLQAHGFEVLRFWNHEVLTETDAVVMTIIHKLDALRRS